MGRAKAQKGWRSALDEWLERLFPERQILLRSGGRVRYVVLSRSRQLGLVAAVLVAAGWVLFASAGLLSLERLVRGKDAEVGRVRVAFHNLIARVSDLENRFAETAGTLERNHDYLLDLVERNPALQRDIKVEGAEAEVDRMKRIRLVNQAVNLHLKWLEKNSGGTDQWDRRPAGPDVSQLFLDALAESKAFGGGHEAVVPDGETLWAERAALGERRRALEQRLVALRDSQRATLFRLTERATNNISAVEKTIAMTGLDLERLLPPEGADAPGGRGGPFVAAPEDTADVGRFEEHLTVLSQHLERFDELQRVVRTVPLAAPAKNYYISSRFGRRLDPLNGRWAMHSGVDLAGVFGSPVRAAAEGAVVFAGTSGRHGRMVEIDHGFGMRTRYGHLHKISVRNGQQVGFRETIGLMGSSGRSTGTHLHYEIVVNGVPLNPVTFLNAGKYVFDG